jgi:succinate dehydrogenase/fumarate reductase cytochrome b subunit
MFRIAMNDGWTEVMYTTMNEIYGFGIFFLCLTALFFIFFHLLTNSVGFSDSMSMNEIFDCYESFFFRSPIEYHLLLV